jgi:poly(beta-D-mannuronate) C5 epimerase
MRHHYRRNGHRRGIGSYVIVFGTVVGAALIGTFVLGRSYSQLALQKEPFDRNEYTPSFDPIEDATLGLSPNSGNAFASTIDVNIRAIEVFPTQTVLLAGGKAVRTINQTAPSTLDKLVRSVGNTQYLAEIGSVVTLKSAVILQHSTMTIAAPTTTEVVMTVKKAVFLAANGAATSPGAVNIPASLTISHVYVHASDANTPNAYLEPTQTEGRPFVLAVADAKMNIDHSTFRYLGRDWNTSYGLSWSKGATGSITNSALEHNFIGVYTNDSPSLKVLNNTLNYNSLYGVDPHSGSSHMDIENNTADYNGRHGIIFSDHVTAGTVRNNTTEYNGLNGIMMDEFSTGNVIEGNTSAFNHSDGIVLANSSNNTVLSNKIASNRIGITVRGSTAGTIALHNTIVHNKKAGQGLPLSHNTATGNGGEWRVDRIVLIWEIAGALLIVLFIVTWGAQRDRPRPGRTSFASGVATA